MSIARDLYQLQELDLELEANSQAQQRISAQIGASQAVLQLKDKIEDRQKKVEEISSNQKSTEWEIDDLTTKINDIEKKLYGGKITNSKELSNMQQESEDFKKRRSSLEDKALGFMDEIEAINKDISQSKEQLSKLETQWQAQQQQLKTELQLLKTAQSELQNKRKEQASFIESGTIYIYDELRKRKGLAVAKVEQGTCRGCRITLPNSNLQQAKSGGLVHCSSCGRIIFLA